VKADLLARRAAHAGGRLGLASGGLDLLVNNASAFYPTRWRLEAVTGRAGGIEFRAPLFSAGSPPELTKHSGDREHCRHPCERPLKGYLSTASQAAWRR